MSKTILQSAKDSLIKTMVKYGVPHGTAVMCAQEWVHENVIRLSKRSTQANAGYNKYGIRYEKGNFAELVTQTLEEDHGLVDELIHKGEERTTTMFDIYLLQRKEDDPRTP